MLPERVHVLVQVPPAASRNEVIKRITGALNKVTKQNRGLARADRVWEQGMWCSVLTSGPAVEAVRRYIQGRASFSRPATTSPL